MKFYILIFLMLPILAFTQDPDVQGEPIFSQTDMSGTPFKRNDVVCFELRMGALGADLIHPTPQGLPFEVNVSTQGMIDRSVEFITSTDPFLDENFFTVTVPTDPGAQINFSQNTTIPFGNYSEFNVCGTIPETAEDGTIVNYQANGDPGGYPENEGSDDPSNQGIVMGTLPIELLRFDAIPGESDVKLEWETATELNNSHFEVQRSADGRNYETIGTVAGNGTTSQVISYDYTDDAPLSGKSYYRLKQVDLDGAFEYSPVEEVSFSGASELKIFPNPAASGTEINIRGPKIRSVQVYNMVGQLLINETYDRPVNQVTLRSTKLPQGMYITKINETTEKRLMIK